MTDAEKVLLCSKVEEAMFLNWPETDVEAVGVCQRDRCFQMSELAGDYDAEALLVWYGRSSDDAHAWNRITRI